MKVTGGNVSLFWSPGDDSPQSVTTTATCSFSLSAEEKLKPK